LRTKAAHSTTLRWSLAPTRLRLIAALLVAAIGPAFAPGEARKLSAATPPTGGAIDGISTASGAGRFDAARLSDPTTPRHILKRFDFNERHLGNVEDVPMYWQQRIGPNLPHYNTGTFDRSIGHNAPPSFRLTAITESVAFTYSRNDIPVEPGSRYLVSAWVRTEGFRKSRAHLAATYVARDLQVIEDTEVISPGAGGPDQNGQWRYVELPTPEAPLTARFLRITVWLAQPEFHRDPTVNVRPIVEQDARVAAWFDDVEVTHMLPAASIRTVGDTPVFSAAQPPEILGPQVNPAHFGLACQISVADEDGRVYYSARTDARDPGQVLPASIRLDSLPCGLYTAKLKILSENRQLGEQQVGFVKLPDMPRAGNSQIGVCLDESSLGAVDAAMACLRGMQVGYVKIPVWTGLLTDSPAADAGTSLKDLLKRILADGLEPIGVFVGPPAGVASSLPASQRTLVDVFAADRQIWQPYMALSLTHYADVVRLWQIGRDGLLELAMDDRYPAAAGAAAGQIVTLIDGAQVALAWPATLAGPSFPRYIKRQSVSLPNAIRPDQMRQCIKQHSGQGRPLWVTVWPIEGERYAPCVRRTDMAKRIVYALAGEAEAVFVPQPWRVHDVGGKAILTPTIEYTVLAALSRAVAGRRYAGSFEWTGGAVFHTFASDDDAALVAWNDQQPDPTAPEAKVSLYLGRKIAAFDLRGRGIPAGGADSQSLPIGQEPIVITGADNRLASLRSQFTIEPRQIASGLRKNLETVKLVNPYAEPMSGTIRLRGPEGWEITPSRLAFSLQPGKTLQENVEIHIPYNEPIGAKSIHADLSIDARRLYQLSIPITLDLQLPGVETYAFSDTTGKDVVIRHVLTNRTDEELNFVGSVLLPTMARQERLFLHVRPGQTLIKEYVIPRGEVADRPQLRISLREINGSRLLNQMVEIF
jgi:hypothetical protein